MPWSCRPPAVSLRPSYNQGGLLTVIANSAIGDREIAQWVESLAKNREGSEFRS